jgi:multidrug efflux pump subunit AcrB
MKVTFLILPALGVSLNMISLFAFIIALGIVVDDAIIIGENVYHYRQEGYPALTAAIKGAQEMAVPVTFSILTNIATFMPLFFMPGQMGKIFLALRRAAVTK